MVSICLVGASRLLRIELAGFIYMLHVYVRKVLRFGCDYYIQE